MDALFLKFFNMSIAAGWLILAVAALRLLLKKAPKAVLCALWALVALRLVCPFSIESALSLLPSAETLPGEALSGGPFTVQTGFVAVDAPLNDYIGGRYEGAAVPDAAGSGVMDVFGALWLAGAALMLLGALISWLRLRRRVAAALHLRGRLWLCDAVDSPFILGIFRPRVYLPSDMDEARLSHAVAHELAHLRRRDHLWKPLGFLLLAAYWFNPLCWLAYILLCRDIELACDERVVRGLGTEGRRAYSAALLSYAMPRRMIHACPLAFGEVGVKERIKTVLNYKKPAFWMIIAAAAACLVLAVCFLTDPPASAEPAPEPDAPRVLTLEKVVELSKKGEALDWPDFAGYPCTDVGSGLYIYKYDIDGNFSVYIGGVPTVAAMYVRLARGGMDDGVNLRMGAAAVSAFIDGKPLPAQTPAPSVLPSPAAEAVVSVSPADTAALGDYDEFDASTDGHGVRLAVTTSAALKNVRIVAVNWDEKAQELSVSGDALYSAAELSPDRPLVVSVSFPGVLATRALVFTGADGAERCLVFLTSGENGSVFLSELPLN